MTKQTDTMAMLGITSRALSLASSALSEAFRHQRDFEAGSPGTDTLGGLAAPHAGQVLADLVRAARALHSIVTDHQDLPEVQAALAALDKLAADR
jgi:hypothetical protein